MLDIDVIKFLSTLPMAHHLDVMRELLTFGDGATHDDLSALPLLSAITTDPLVLRLTEGYVLDPCRHIHLNVWDYEGKWHPDNYDEGPWPGEFLMLFYYPQFTPLQLGPTQFRSRSGDIISGDGPPGTCVLARHDIEHRTAANIMGFRRIMARFHFRKRGAEMPAPLKKSEFIEKVASQSNTFGGPDAIAAAVLRHLARIERSWEDYVETFAEAEARENKQ